jgi:hypothetical protein
MQFHAHDSHFEHGDFTTQVFFDVLVFAKY